MLISLPSQSRLDSLGRIVGVNVATNAEAQVYSKLRCLPKLLTQKISIFQIKSITYEVYVM